MNLSKRRISRTVLHVLPAVLASGMSLLAPSPAMGQEAMTPNHFVWAADLVTHVAPENNEYGSPGYVTWAYVGGQLEYRNRSLCTTFVTQVIKHAYALSNDELKRWFGSTSPNVALYHSTITREIGFKRVEAVGDIKAGDILAITYPEGSGHVALAAGTAALRSPIYPVISGTSQYELPVMDSSSSGHGMTDTRRQANGTWHQGVGKGTMRLYADSAGTIVGYSWSFQSGSTYYPRTVRDLVIGRISVPTEEVAVPH